MCEPTTIAIGGATMLNMYAQHQQGKANAEAAYANAGVARQNSQVAFAQGRAVEQQGVQDASMQINEGNRVAASARVATAANGIDANTGAGANMQTVSLINSEIDAARTRSNAAREAWGYKQEGEAFKRQAEMLRRQAKQQGKLALLNVLGAGMSGGGSMMSAYSNRPADEKKK